MVLMRCIIMKFPLAYSIKKGLLGLRNVYRQYHAVFFP